MGIKTTRITRTRTIKSTPMKVASNEPKPVKINNEKSTKRN